MLPRTLQFHCPAASLIIGDSCIKNRGNRVRVDGEGIQTREGLPSDAFLPASVANGASRSALRSAVPQIPMLIRRAACLHSAPLRPVEAVRGAERGAGQQRVQQRVCRDHRGNGLPTCLGAPGRPDRRPALGKAAIALPSGFWRLVGLWSSKYVTVQLAQGERCLPDCQIGRP